MEFNIFKRPHIMMDIEALSTRQNASIVSIGAVSFTFENGIEHEFLVNIDPASSVDLNLHVSKETIDWWLTQPKEVRNAWRQNPKAIKQALNHFNAFVGNDDKQMIWAQGTVYDIGNITYSMDLLEIKHNWKYWNVMDSRTIFNLLGIRNDVSRDGEEGHHTALADARAQALTLIDIFKDLK